jgi:Tetratricopeptide repeat
MADASPGRAVGEETIRSPHAGEPAQVAHSTPRVAGLCLLVALTVAAVVLLRYTPRFSHWQGLDLPGALERPEYGRAKATLGQVENPWAPVEASLHTVIRWRLAFPVVWHYLRLPRWLLLAMPSFGCVLVLWQVAWLTYQRQRDWRATWLTTALFAALPWFFVSTGWLLHFDSWLVLGLLSASFVPSRVALVAACLATPWIDERFLLALPVCLIVRVVSQQGRQSHGPSPRRAMLLDLAILVAASCPYVAIRAAVWLHGDPVATAYVESHWTKVQSVPWQRLLEGLWSGYRAAWVMIVAAMLLAPRTAGRLCGAVLAVVTISTAVGGLLIAMDMSRTLMMISPVLLLGIWLWESWRPATWRFVLPAIAVANLALPAAHVMWNQRLDISALSAELDSWRTPPDFFAAARLIIEAEKLINSGQMLEGSALLDEAIRLDRRYPNAFVKRAAVRMHDGDFAAAEPDLQEALELDADNATGHFLLGVVLASRGKMAAAADHFRLALAHAPPDWPARNEAEQFLREATAAARQP